MFFYRRKVLTHLLSRVLGTGYLTHLKFNFLLLKNGNHNSHLSMLNGCSECQIGTLAIIDNKWNTTITGKNPNARIVRDVIAWLQLFPHPFNHLCHFFLARGLVSLLPQGFMCFIWKALWKIRMVEVTLAPLYYIHSDWRDPEKESNLG